MPRSAMFSVVLLVLGVVVFIWGFNASESLASNVSETVQGAPSNKAMARTRLLIAPSPARP